jgi:hypothetical protein
MDYAVTPVDPDADWDCRTYGVCMDMNSVQVDGRMIHVTMKNGFKPKFADIDCKARLIRVVDPSTGRVDVVSFYHNGFAISMCGRYR